MKLNFQQKFNLIMLVAFIAGAVLVTCSSGIRPDACTNPSNTPGNNSALVAPER
ncbi:MAG TPA: hypothetical protein VG737_11360 [Cyclobacteriaceae bacterium]|nr:hypothetical protein [Cyclobacteriaceae bacterium]